MRATLITIGDEILIGQIVDTNSAWMAQQLNAIGVTIFEILTVNDDRDHLFSAFAKAEQQSDIVLVTGGLGPTKDDVTKATFCEYYSDQLVENSEVLQHIEDIFKRYVKDDILPENRLQAMVPSKAQILHNQYGTAPGMWFERDWKVLVSMPGVPFEMKSLMESEVLPRIRKRGNLPFIYHRTLITSGKGESVIANMIADIEDSLPKQVKLAYLPGAGQVRLRLSSTGNIETDVRKAVDVEIDKIKLVLGALVIAEAFNDSPVERLSNLFKAAGKTLSTAESCTGGKIANLITEIPGASQFFAGSTVTYATQSKMDILGIEPSIIANNSVVSAAVAVAMAQAVKDKFNTDYAVATTGNAGPEKGDSDAAVGTVFIGVATPSGTEAHEFMMGSHRERVIGKTVNKSIELLIRELQVAG